MSEAETLRRLQELEERLTAAERERRSELGRLEAELSELRRLVAEAEDHGLVVSGPEHFKRRVEWTISGFSAKQRHLSKGESIWSPKFRAAGLDGLQLEFFPNGREKTTYEGFCSLFLWCPAGTKVKYQLFVGSFLRPPDEDEFAARIGHGHSNFCPIGPEINRSTDCVCLGVDFMDVVQRREPPGGLRFLSRSLEAMVAREAEVVQNRGVNRVLWRIRRISEQLRQLPRGASLWSRLFTASGIPEILLEFYPNGSINTTKDGFCGFYIRCPEGVSVVVTLFVGKVRKGPIKTTFETLTGKGLPDFCPVADEVSPQDDSLEVGIELQNQPSKTLVIES